MDFGFIFGGMFVIWIALFKRELLVDRETVPTIVAIAIGLFIVGIFFHFTASGRESASGALLWPILSFGWYRLTRRVFLRMAGHEPKDTSHNWTPGLAADRFFNIIFFTSSLVGGMLFTIGMQELAKRGW